MINNLKELDTDKTKYKAIELLYDIVDSFLEENDYLECDNFIKVFLNEKFSPRLYISLLTITFKYKKFLLERDNLFIEGEKVLLESGYTEKQVDSTLYGLK
jgi:hypothetical protein